MRASAWRAASGGPQPCWVGNCEGLYIVATTPFDVSTSRCRRVFWRFMFSTVPVSWQTPQMRRVLQKKITSGADIMKRVP